MTADELNAAKLEIERERLSLEKLKAQADARFISRNAGVLISAAVSCAAVVVSVAQIWVSSNDANTQQRLAQEQRYTEMQLQQSQREREFAAADAQRKRELDLGAARLIIENRKTIFEDASAQDREILAMLLSVVYPPEVSEPLLRRLQQAAPKTDQKIWESARHVAAQGASAFSPDKRVLATVSAGRIQLWDANSGQLMRIFSGPDLYSSASFSPDGKMVRTSTVDGRSDMFEVATGLRVGSVSDETTRTSPAQTTTPAQSDPRDKQEMGQEQSISGRVVSGDGAPLPGARLTIVGPRRAEVWTNQDGAFIFRGPDGAYQISVTTAGKSGSFRATVASGRLLPSLFVLK